MKLTISLLPVFALLLTLITLASAGVANPFIAMKIGCYPTGNAVNPKTAMSYKTSACGGLLNGDNCLRFCGW